MSSQSNSRQTGFWERLELILRHRLAFTIVMVLAIGVGFTHAFLAKQYFRSSTAVLPPAKDPTTLGGMIPSIGAAAVALGGLLDDDVIMVTTVLESRSLQDSVINHFHWMDEHEFKYRRQAYKRWQRLFNWEFAELGFFAIRFDETSPKLAHETVQYIVDQVNSMYTKISVAQAGTQREFLEKRLNQNRADLAAAEEAMKEFQERTGVILMEEQIGATVEALGELHKQLVLLEVQEQVAEQTLPYGSTEAMSAGEQVRALRDKIRELNRTSEKEAKSYLIAMDVAPEVGMEYFRLMREIEIQGQILELLLPNYEMAKLQEMKDVGSLYILDLPTLPEKKIKPKRAFVILGWMILFFFAFYAFISFKEWLTILDDENPERYDRVSNVLALLNPINYFRFRNERTPDSEL